MKKSSFLIILLITIVYSFNVYAKDTVISLNKYSEEKFNFIEKAYDVEGKHTGYITGGHVLKETIELEDNKYNDYQAIVVKYDDKNKVEWKYLYGQTKEDYLDCLSYTYDAEGKIDGYLLVSLATSNVDEPNSNESVFIKLSLDGKEVSQKALNINNQVKINKIVTTYNNEGIVDGYIAIGNSNGNSSYLIKLDRELNIVWSRTTYKDNYEYVNYLDLTTITQDKKVIGYALLKELGKGNLEKEIKLFRYNLNGEEPVQIGDDFNKYSSYSLAEANDGFIIYGATPEVKLSKGDNSYYLINYNANNENYWETVGDSPLDKDKNVRLLPLKRDNEIKEYLLLYSNNIAKSSEIVKIKADGEIKDKIKKIYDEYYNITEFTFTNDVIYLVGQINCPKDDTCEYDSNSLFLVSDEEKVIEVKDNDSRNVLIIMGIFIIMIIGTILYRRKRTLKYVK